MSDSQVVEGSPVPAGPAESSTPTPAPVEAPAPVADALGEGGKKALEAERSKRKDLERRMKELEPLAAKARELEDAQKTEVERLNDQLAALKSEAASARADSLRLQVAAEVGLPADLLEFLPAGDEESLREKAQKLMAATAAAGDKRSPAPDPTQGAKPGSGPAQLTEADLARMSPSEIVKAKSEGRFDTLLGYSGR